MSGAAGAERAFGAEEAQKARAIVAELRALGSAERREGMARYAINVEHAFGVSIPTLRQMAKRLGRDQALASALWASGEHEARLLACFVGDPARLTPEQMDTWAADFDSWDLCDQATTSLFDQSKHAWAKATAWAKRPEPWIKRGGFALMAGLAVHDKVAPGERFAKFFPLIERGAFDERNFVKKAVSWALRNIGKRSLELHRAAVACAERIAHAADAKAGGPRGGSAEVRAARWVAADALRELTSDSSRRVRRRVKDQPR